MKSFIASLSVMLLLALSPAANASIDNPFGMSKVSTDQVQLAEGKCGQGKCGDSMKKEEGKCGNSSKKDEAKCGEGKCGEGKCGGAA